MSNFKHVLVELGVCQVNPKKLGEQGDWGFYQVPISALTPICEQHTAARKRFLETHEGTLVFHTWMQGVVELQEAILEEAEL